MSGRNPVLRSFILVAGLGLLVMKPEVQPDGTYPNGHLLANTQWLKQRMSKPNVRIVDLRGDIKYTRGHIPGAVPLDLSRTRATIGGIPGMAAPPKQLAAVFGSLGIGEKTTVVAYDDVGGLHAARLFWTLEYAGHRRVKILNGGFQAWVAAGGKLSRKAASYPPARYRVSLDTSRVVTAKEIRAKLGSPNTVLVDARTAGEFTGVRRIGRQGGHIPGAVNIEWLENLSGRPGSWLPRKKLERLYSSRGVTQEKEIIAYCQTFHRAAHTYFTLRLLGYKKVRGYDGSWAEWASRPKLPVAN